MKRNTWKTLALSGMAAAAIVAGSLWVADSVSASTSTTTPLDWVQELVPERGGRGGGPRGIDHGQDSALLAEALGVTQEELQAAHQQAMNNALDQAVEKGLITQEQADALKARNSWRMTPGLGRMGGFGRFGSEIDFDTLLASALGVSVDELNAARESAWNKRLEQAVSEGSITQEQADLMKAQFALRGYLTERMQSAYEEAVKQAVEDGAITQEQADLLNSQPRGFGRGFEFGFGGPHGHGGGRFDGRGGMRGAPNQSAPTETPVAPNS